MPRSARYVFAGVPHHVTQRGNRRERVFFANDDYCTYLRWLQEYAGRYEVDVLAYCLMPNHVHLVLIPPVRSALQLFMRSVHARYAQRVNRNRDWRGHVWQGRYFSSALDEAYLWAAIRYVERNPVSAGMTARADEYPWSSAPAHCERTVDPLLSVNRNWLERVERVGSWSAWLAQADSQDCLDTLRQRTDKGLPCGSAEFLAGLEAISGKPIRHRKPGRPRKLRAA